MIPRRDGPTGPSAGKPVTPVVAPAPPGSPPDPRLAWAAEVEWRQIDGESRFCVIARGAGTVEIARSAALDWPPEGPAAVQAVTDAANKLAATLVAAGWKPLPPGTSWYAKRFEWEPAIARACQAPHQREAAAPPRPAPRAPTSAAPDRVPGKSSRVKQLVLLGGLAVVALIAALQFGDGGGTARGGAEA